MRQEDVLRTKHTLRWSRRRTPTVSERLRRLVGLLIEAERYVP